MGRKLIAATGLLALVAAGAVPAGLQASPADLDMETCLFLVGDAGHPDPRGEPVLEALGRELARDPERAFVVFLGDNIYPAGMPEPDDPWRGEAQRRIDAQIDAVRVAGARAVFVPGNHDWDRQRGDGWAAVRRQSRYVQERGGRLVSFLPPGGCPGPEVVDVGARLRVVALDTQWWLHEGPKPGPPDSGCASDTEAAVLAALRQALAGAGERAVVVAAHHPLASGGTHGGHFGWKDHVFPLREWKPWLWLPLPGIGSIYPLARQGGVAAQDLSSARYTHMRDALEAVLRGARPLAWAAGHEHSLQVMDGNSARHVLVSGAGIYGHTRAPKRLPGSRFASGKAGFMRLDIGRDGSAHLAVIAVDATGSAAVRYSEPLR